MVIQGFSKDSSRTVTHKINTSLKLDDVNITDVDVYIIDGLAGCDILIGRNVTERCDLIYSRIGDSLRFNYADTFNEFCNSMSEFVLNSETHLNELTALFTKYSECVASHIK